MDLEDISGSGAKVKLGIVERWSLTAGFGLLVFLLGWVFHNFDSRLEQQGAAMTDMAKQQAVTNARLDTLSQQLADVPSLRQSVAELQVRVERNTADIHDLQVKRGN